MDNPQVSEARQRLFDLVEKAIEIARQRGDEEFDAVMWYMFNRSRASIEGRKAVAAVLGLDP